MNDNNVIPFPGATSPDDVLRENIGRFKRLVIIGRDADGDLCLCGSNMTVSDVGWDMEVAKRMLLEAALG